MQEKIVSPKESKRRKLLLVLPLITLPFLTFLFYSLGGGGMEAKTAENGESRGFNFNLPLPKFKEDSALDKMSYYDQAAADSTKLREQIKKDPNYFDNKGSEDKASPFSADDFGSGMLPKSRSVFNPQSFQDRNEQKVYEKLRALEKAISQPAVPNAYGQDMREFESYGSSKSGSDAIKNLEQMISQMGTSEKPDPELKQLGGMLENILDIQHPQRVQERLKESSDGKKGKIYQVQKKAAENIISSLEQNANPQSLLKTNAFYSLDEEQPSEAMQNSIEAAVHQTQAIVNGSVVKLRLSNDIFLQGTAIPKNTFLYGTAALKGERLEVKITSIQYSNSIFPVELAVYDIDGGEGIYIPGAISRDAAKASADRSIQTLGLASVSDSWGAQAAGMGIEAAKSLLGKKVKLVKVVVKAGYQVLLYDEKQKNVKP
ncbi:conjugative transposon protein TraM [Flavobacterium tistrianum]|uniref:conjugative transposon protein TraM n=1 Tax=Flavobacterium tistrianum TaxID=1685414 RepID=UPI000DAE820C|nr:conjugative transposon protein TraM [Flavobacterium tistrianum]KAF2342875.1 conjugative transposon protein TraM [Flavobacterium tistrianum]